MAAKKTTKKQEPAVTEEPKTPKPKYAEDDNSIDARMWRLEQDHKAMGSR